MAGNLDVVWIHGAANCAASTDPALQVHRYDADTFILRQSKCSAVPESFEGPFLYLLFGSERTLLLDTGASAAPSKFPVAATVNQIRHSHAAAAGHPLRPLLIAHSHSHGDHTAGDSQFANLPDVMVVPHSLTAVKQFFGLSDWPNGAASIDLGGGRVLDVIPTPGHEPSHLTIYDRREQLLLTGDTLYPGLLVVNNWPDYRKSIARLAAFVAAGRSIRWVLGAHIEMTSTSGRWFGLGATFQPKEHLLQLGLQHLDELHAAMVTIGDHPRVDRHADFIIYPASEPLPSLDP